MDRSERVERELTAYECRPHQLCDGAWYYHTLGEDVEVVINLRECTELHGNTIMLKIPLKPILEAEQA